MLTLCDTISCFTWTGNYVLCSIHAYHLLSAVFYDLLGLGSMCSVANHYCRVSFTVILFTCALFFVVVERILF